MTVETKTLPQDLATLVDCCQRIGQQIPSWTQGAGGNVSVKIGDELWIKASGFRLDGINHERGIVSLPLSSSRAAFHRMVSTPENCEVEYANWLREKSQSKDLKSRASMESSFHALLPKKWVIHFHSLAAILMSEQLRQGRKFLTDLDHEICHVRNVLPGLCLSRELLLNSDKSIFILQHHGVVLQGDSLLALEEWSRIEADFMSKFEFKWMASWYQRSMARKILGKRILPFRVIFPDAAVFEGLIRSNEAAFLGAIRSAGDEDTVQFVSARFERKTRDAFEIWFATQLILQSQPEFPSWSHDLVEKVQVLPTEAFRKQ